MPNNPYADIIHLPHHVSKVHPQMSMHQRAAQFSPFAALVDYVFVPDQSSERRELGRALVGYEDVIDETARQTDSIRELDETEKAELDRKLGILASHLKEKPVVEIEYFVPDKTKAGGEYVFKSGTVEKIVSAERVVIVGGEAIRMDRIVGIEGQLFDGEF